MSSNTALAKWLFTSGENSGVFLGKAHESGKWKNKSVLSSDLLDVFAEKEGESDWYITLNTFRVPLHKRTASSILHLHNYWIDFDCHTVGISPEEALRTALSRLRQLNIQKPSVAIFSGRGLWLVWHFEAVEEVDSEERVNFSAYQRMLVHLFKDLGADSQCVDPGRFCRLPGSINSKSGTKVDLKLLTKKERNKGSFFSSLRVAVGPDEAGSFLELSGPEKISVSAFRKQERERFKQTFFQTVEATPENLGVEQLGPIRPTTFDLWRGRALFDMLMSHLDRVSVIEKGNRQNFLFHVSNALSLQGKSWSTVIEVVEDKVFHRLSSYTPEEKAEWLTSIRSPFKIKTRDEGKSAARGYAFSAETLSNRLGIDKDITQKAIYQIVKKGTVGRFWAWVAKKDAWLAIRKDRQHKRRAIFAMANMVCPKTGKRFFSYEQIGKLFAVAPSTVCNIQKDSRLINSMPSKLHLAGALAFYVQSFFFDLDIAKLNLLQGFYLNKNIFMSILNPAVASLFDWNVYVLHFMGLIDEAGKVVSSLV